MADDIQSMMFELLKRMQGDVAALKTDMAEAKVDIAEIKDRLERVERATEKHARDSAAMLVMMRGTVGVFEERVSRLEGNWPR